MDVVDFQLHSCEWCDKIVFDLHKYEEPAEAVSDLTEQLEEGTSGSALKPPTNQDDDVDMAKKGVLFGVRFEELCAGAAAGCRLFTWIMDDEWMSRAAIHDLARKDLNIDDPKDELGWAFRDSSLWFEGWLPKPCPENTLHKIRDGAGDALNQCFLWASTYQGTGNPLDMEFVQFFGLWDRVTKKIVYRTRHAMQAFAEPDDPASDFVSNRPIARYPGSSANLAKISSWLRDCQEHHSCKSMLGAMPTRLIEITGAPDAISLRLRETGEVGRVPFAALSYCWGGEQPMKCLSSNIASYRTVIPFEEQPLTIRDAVKVCQGAGLQHLWIDALCIIQDDPRDKSAEIAKMTSIYGSATVTIAAARSSSAKEGFLAERLPGPREGVSVSYRCETGRLGSIVLARFGEGFEPAEPIDERGWTLQERLLSSRIIEFGSRQTRWICPATRSRGFSLAGFTDGWRRDVKSSSLRQAEALDLDNIRAAKSTIDFYGRPRNSQFREYLKAIDHWGRICETFTQRELALSSDRALGIAGIAQIYAELSGDQYIAGLWKSCFHAGLLWKIEHSHMDPKDIPPPPTYQGPSWSWLSVNGPVKFGQAWRPSECVAEILSCETEAADETAPYGLVREGSGRLVLAARTAPGIRTRVPLRSAGKFKDWVMIVGVGKSVVCYATAELHCDIQDAEPNEVEDAAGCLVVEIVRRSDGDKLSCQGLVLRWGSPERKTYSRLGRFSYYGERKGRLFAEHVKDGEPEDVDFDWFTDEPKVIEII